MSTSIRNICRLHQISNQFTSCARYISTTQAVARNAIWPPEKIRRTGQKPTAWKGQGGSKAKIPYDRRYPLSGKDINDSFEGLRRGGSSDMNRMIGEERAKSNPAVLKYFDYEKEREIMETVPEMIPEFMVPDLTGFKLKPYVSYSLDNAPTRPQHTPEELFKATYQPKILKEHNKTLPEEADSET